MKFDNAAVTHAANWIGYRVEAELPSATSASPILICIEQSTKDRANPVGVVRCTVDGCSVPYNLAKKLLARTDKITMSHVFKDMHPKVVLGPLDEFLVGEDDGI